MNTETKAPRPTIAYVEDCEGDGTCQLCEREGLRWIVVLSDGSRAGVECVKSLLGFKPAPKSYSWVKDYTGKGMTVTRFGQTLRVWEHKNGAQWALTVDGNPVSFGPRDFIAKAFAQRANG